MPNIVRFDAFEVDLESRQLLRRGKRVKLRSQSFQVLAALLEYPRRVVTREDLRRRLWCDEVFVDFENNLNIAIARLREALGDSAERPRFIETLPKYGYRFIGTVFDQSAPARRFRLIVLPFVNLSGDPAQDYFGDAMTDEIITAIAGVAPEHLAVIARTTAMLYKGSRKGVGRIGRELGVEYVVEGGVRRDGNQVAINVQLIQTRDQAQVFASKYDADIRDIFSIQNCIAQAIAAHIPSIPEGVRVRAVLGGRAKRKPTEDVVAYDLYLKGRHQTSHDLPDAKQYFEQAIARDPHFALAYDGLGEYYWRVGFVGFAPPKEAFTAGLWAALRAIEIDNTLAETHALIGQFRKVPDYNWTEVSREMDLALKLNPASPLVRLRNAVSRLMPLGHLAEAISELETVLDSDPLDLDTRSWLGVMHWLARRYDCASEQLRLALEIDPHFVGSLAALGIVRCEEHKFDEAIALLRETVEARKGAVAWLGWLGLALAQRGDIAEARGLLQHLHGMAERAYVPASCFAWTHLGLGDIDETFTWMDRAIDQYDPMITPIKSYPFLDPIRSDPRFAALLRKMNLAP